MLVLLFRYSALAVAGQTADTPWATPINLSLSGSASEPQIIADSAGLMHIIWQDSLDDYVYLQGDGITWSETQPVELPFGTRRFYPDLDEDDPTPLFKPNLVVDEEGILHAVWIDDVGDLYHSSVAFEGITDFSNWKARYKIASSVLTASLDTGPDGRLHLAYIQTAEDEELEPGVFYTQSDNGETWLDAVPLATSIYFRLLEEESAHLQLAVANENLLFVAWDDWPHERVVTIRSIDGGLTWDEVREVDKRQEDDDATAVGPSAIQIVANNDIVHLIWQAGHEELTCSPYYQWSTDGGESWQPAQTIWDSPTECPTEISFEENGNSYMLRATTTIGSLISLWTGTEWGTPQPQFELDNARDPETFKPITYTCGQDSLGLPDKILLVACGQGESSQDIWLLSRSLTFATEEESIWTLPSALAKTTAPINDPMIVADESNRFHAFWGRIDTDSSPNQEHQTVDIQYTRWEEGQWSTPKTILTPATGGDSELSVVVDQSRRLLIVWTGAKDGEIYFSRVSTGLAILSSEWSEPQLLSNPDSIGSSPTIAVDNNTIYVVYAVPVNEERGVYLVKSLDGGNTWTEPNLVFELESADWGLIDKPRLAVTGDGHLHLLWLNEPVIGTGDTSLYYANSPDGGETWSLPAIVAPDEQKDATVLWSQITSAEGGIVNRVWQEWSLGQISLWHQLSTNEGQNWSQPVRVIGLNVAKLPTTLAMDRTGQLHLIYFDKGSPETTEGVFTLLYWVWRGDQWHREESLLLNKQPILDVNFLSASVSPNNQLAVLYSGPVQADADTLQSLYFTDRAFDLPETNVTPVPVPTLVATVTPEPSPTVMIDASPTPFATLSPSQSTVQPVGGQTSPMDGALIGSVAATIPLSLLFIVFVIKQYRIKKN